MVCTFCNSETKVINSRHQKKANATWRRRLCSNCAEAYTTTETYDLDGLILVANIKTNLEDFQRDKLFLSIHTVLLHRKTAISDATGLTNTVIQLILAQKKHIIPKSVIAQTTFDVLDRFDHLSALQYKALHTK